MAFFFLSSLMAIYCSIKNFIGSRNVTYKNQLDILSYMLPFVSFIIDATVKRAYSMSAKSIFIGIKVIFIFYYLCIYVIALQKTPNTKWFWMANVNLLLFPIIITIYWWFLLRGKLS